MPKTDSESAMISLRVNASMQAALIAVAYADLVSKMGTTVMPSEVNLSEFLRDVIEDVVTTYANGAGGIEALLEEYNAARIRELESEIKSVRGTAACDAAAVAEPATSRRGRRRQPVAN